MNRRSLVLLLLLGACGRDGWQPPRSTSLPSSLPPQVTGWSKEQIAGDPVGYLGWAIAELDGLERRLQGHRVELQALGHRLTREAGSDEALDGARRRQREELRALYEERLASGGWPVLYGGVPFDRPALERLLLESDDAVAAFEQRRTTAPAALKKVDRQAREIEEKLQQIAAQRVRLVEAQRFARLNRDVSKLGALVASTNELIDESAAAADFGVVNPEARDFLPTAQDEVARGRLEKLGRKGGG